MHKIMQGIMPPQNRPTEDKDVELFSFPFPSLAVSYPHLSTHLTTYIFVSKGMVETSSNRSQHCSS